MLHLRRSGRFQLPCLPSAYLRTSSRLPSGRNNFTKLDFNGYVVVSWWCLLIEEEWIFHNSLHVTQDPITGQCFPFKVSNVEGMGRFVTFPNTLSIQTCASVHGTYHSAMTASHICHMWHFICIYKKSLYVIFTPCLSVALILVLMI